MGKLVSKLFAVFMVILFIAVFRSMIINDPSVSAAFEGLISALPFAEPISEAVCKFLQISNTIKPITAFDLISDFLKLAVMAAIQPLCVSILTAMFLPVPDGDWYDREEYMDSMGYRMKEMLVTFLTAPLIALLAAQITTMISGYISSQFGSLVSPLLGIVSVGVFTALSIIPLFMAGLSLGTALIWRLCITFLMKMATTMGINIICIWLYFAIAGGIPGQTFASIISLFIWLAIMDFALQCLQRVIVS